MANSNLFSSACFLMIPFIGYGIFKFKGLWQYFSVLIFAYLILTILFLQVRSTWLALVFAIITTTLATLAFSGEFLRNIPKVIGPLKTALIAVVFLIVVSALSISIYPKLKTFCARIRVSQLVSEELL